MQDRKSKRILTTALTGILAVGMLAGCGGKTDPAADTKSASDASDSEAGAAIIEGFQKVALPLSEEKVTLKVWTQSDPLLMDACGGDLNATPFYQELEKRTNVHIEWVPVANGTELEQFNLMIASGEMCDIVFTNTINGLGYQDGDDAAIDDGYYLDLTDLLPQYAPNYLAALKEAGASIEQSAKTDLGRYAMMYKVSKEEQPPFMGYLVRKDWLEELSLPSPETYDDWEKMLTAFKEEKGAAAPLAINKDFIWDLGVGMEAYGSFYQKDGEVRYGLYSDPENCKEYLTLLNRWYGNQLIDPDFASATFWLGGDPVLVTNDKTGCFNAMYTMPSTQYLPSMGEGASFEAVNTPVKEKGDQLKSRFRSSQLGGEGYAISADCEHPEIAVKWIDYLFSPEGFLFNNYGTEGDTYTLDESGEPVYTDMILNNPDGLSFDTALRMYTSPAGTAGVYVDYRRELQGVPEEDVAYMYKWGEPATDYNYPEYAFLNAEENAEYADLYSDIETYVEENVLSFITGAKSLEEYDAFRENLENMNIERCIELKQAALDRFNAR